MPTSYEANTDVTLSVTVPSPNGTQLASASSVDYAVFDEEGTEVKASAALIGYTGGDTAVEVTVGAANNALASGAVRGARRVEVYFTTPSGIHTASSIYLIEAKVVLVVADNSFCTIEQAHMEEADMVDLTGWNGATDDEKVTALVAAYLSLCRMTYRYQFNEGQNYLNWPNDRDVLYTVVRNIRDMTKAEFLATPASFRRAIRRAQLAEANVILDGDPFHSRREQGVISETIGESKVFMQPIPAIRTPVSRAAMNELRGFLYRTQSIGRA